MKLVLSVRELKTQIRKFLFEINTDPSDNPGRPQDPYDYLGMRPRAGLPMAHPALTGDTNSNSSQEGEVSSTSEEDTT